MSNGFQIKVQDLDKSLAKLNLIKKSVAVEFKKELDIFGLLTVGQAKDLAPVDESHLKNSITYAHTIQEKGFGIEIIVAANYAAYIEFGTRKFAAQHVATLPPDWQAFAAKFKGGGGGGSIDDMILRLIDWVHRKGLAGTYKAVTYDVATRKANKVRRTGGKRRQLEEDYDVAYVIARHILINGVRAHPFLFPAYENQKKVLIDNLKKPV